MRTYYIFMVNEHIAHFYQHQPSALFQVFEQIYALDHQDLVLGYRIFEQIAYPFHKHHLNEYIYNKHGGELSYSRQLNSHVINNLYLKEQTKITIYNSHLKVRSNLNYPGLITTLKEFDDNLFVCDFINKDYFWLDQIKTEMLVKS